MSFGNEITRWLSVRTDYVHVGYKHKVGFHGQRARGETGGGGGGGLGGGGEFHVLNL